MNRASGPRPAARPVGWYPGCMDEFLSRITVDPEVCGGRPCIRGMRIRVIDVLEQLAAGSTPDEIVADFPYVELDDIRASLLYAARRLDHPTVAA